MTARSYEPFANYDSRATVSTSWCDGRKISLIVRDPT